jgi:hypothetical protein
MRRKEYKGDDDDAEDAEEDATKEGISRANTCRSSNSVSFF